MEERLRALGYDMATGKQAYAVTQPGSALDKACDVVALETATMWHSLTAAMIDGPELSADEANMVLARVLEALGEVLPIAARSVADNPAADLPTYRTSGRDIGAAMRDMRQ
ncbi:hypothetical protein ABT124_15855 [Streptomyces sp. NPDC001982]|uniref:hypothetical protein n=1 Tax=Streptomyces sp. NPDC001982 TaxID=3154405 RepID=UPI00332FA30E